MDRVDEFNRAYFFKKQQFFLGPLEKKSHQNLGSQSAPVHMYIFDSLSTEYNTVFANLFKSSFVLEILKRSLFLN
jgi:hypothetical protein